MRNFQIDTEFKSLIPALSAEEYAQLEINLIAEGCRDALVIWNGFLLDGHNRFSICKLFDITFKTICIDLASRTEAKTWIIKNQLGRRNLTPETRIYLIGQLYNQRKKATGAQSGNQNAEKQCGQNVHIVSTAQKIAEEFKVDEKTVRRAAHFASAVDKLAANTSACVKEKILSREISATQAEILALSRKTAIEQRSILGKIQQTSLLFHRI